MKIQTPNLQLNSKKQTSINETPKDLKSQVAFKGAIDTAAIQALRFLDTNQAWGANFVDVAFMDTPRTVVDFTRGPAAGLETMRREFSGTTNHTLIGAYGMGAAYLLAQGLNKDFGVKANKMFVNDDTIDILGQYWHDKVKAAGPIEEIKEEKLSNVIKGFLKETFSQVEAFNPVQDKKLGWVKLDTDAQKDIVETLHNEINKSEALSGKTRDYLKALIGYSTGTETKFKLTLGKKETELTSESLISDVYKMAKAFKEPNVLKEFGKELKDNAFLSRLQKLNTRTSLLGLGIAALVGVNIQPFNMYLTKKKTGQAGFVGGGEADKTNNFKLLKLAAAGAFGAMVMSTISNPSKLMKNIQFKGLIPTLNQFKVIYGLTIMSRLLSSRNKNELRETTTKDTLGFLNWMVFGGFVTKLTAGAFQKFAKMDLIKYNEEGKGWFNWLKKAELLTRDEVLYSELKKAGKEVVKGKDAIPFKKMLELAEKEAPSALKKIKYLNVAQLAGYTYSGLVLGIGVPKLNIAITKHFRKKHEKQEKAKANSQQSIAFTNNETKTPKAFANFSGK